jgi:inorganic triphosphatase YgiF
MNDVREVEAKFDVSPDAIAALESINGFAEFTVVQRSVKRQNDLYYDTEHGHLKHAGASLRIRRGENAARMTFKGRRIAEHGQEHVVSRLEDEVSVDADSVTHLTDDQHLHLTPEPSPLQRARLLALNTNLVPTARLVTTRTVLLARDAGQHEIEIAIDCCEATRLSDLRNVEFVEVELELKHGDRQVLMHAIEELMQVVDGLTPSFLTKLERALG